MGSAPSAAEAGVEVRQFVCQLLKQLVTRVSAAQGGDLAAWRELAAEPRIPGSLDDPSRGPVAVVPRNRVHREGDGHSVSLTGERGGDEVDQDLVGPLALAADLLLDMQVGGAAIPGRARCEGHGARCNGAWRWRGRGVRRCGACPPCKQGSGV